MGASDYKCRGPACGPHRRLDVRNEDGGPRSQDNPVDKAFQEGRNPRKAEILEAARQIKGERAIDKRMARAKREANLADRIRSAAANLNTGVRFGVIAADPPWRFKTYSRETGMDRAAENHYPTMTVDHIKALQVPSADDCVLFLWTTAPMLPEALAHGVSHTSRTWSG